MSRWVSTIESDIIASSERKDVEPIHSEGMLSAGESSGSLFEPTSDIDTELRIGDVTKDVPFDTWSAQTIKRAYAEQVLMDMACEQNDDTLFGKAWTCGVVPCMETVLVREAVNSVAAFTVLWNFQKLLMVWPVKRHKEHIEIPPEGSQELQFRCLTYLDKLYIAPTMGHVYCVHSYDETRTLTCQLA